jgi:hypothetical protein
VKKMAAVTITMGKFIAGIVIGIGMTFHYLRFGKGWLRKTLEA